MQNRGGLLALYLLFLTCLGQPLFADITTFALDFSSTTGLVFNQNAAPSVDNLKLVDGNFSFGDGLAFVIQTSSDGTGAIGTDGAQVGFGGIVSSLAIEFAANSVDNNAAFVGCGLNVANDATSCNFANSVNLSALALLSF